MLGNEPWLRDSQGIKTEAVQAIDEGLISKEDKEALSRFEEVINLPEGGEKEKEASELLDWVQTLNVMPGYKYYEPNSYDEIKKAKTGQYDKAFTGSDEKLYDKIYGGWLGRCAGCLLGKPVEGWHSDRITGLLKDTGNYPISFYISSDIDKSIREKYSITDEASDYGNTKKAWINNVSGMPEDDDTNYTVLGLIAAEKYGRDMTSDEMGSLWLKSLPILHTCTAERVAYKNLINLKLPPLSASYRNPYREWIGAQIRADAFGYIFPGNPQAAAKLCYEDAALSHIKNGIYGEMWVGAMIALSFCEKNIEDIIKLALCEIPQESRLFEAIGTVIKWHDEGISYDEASKIIHTMYDEEKEHDWCHVISNAMIVAVALLYGDCDFEKTIGMATEIGFDTDCNAATAGSVLGVLLGAKNLPVKWIGPLNDSLTTGVDGLGNVKISDMAKRTFDLAKKLSGEV